jgi:hypothetical protein
MRLIILSTLVLTLTGCASQQAAQSHWDWINSVGKSPEQLKMSGFAPSYGSGVNIYSGTVNGRGFTAVVPAR